jgi:hypothetical protein
MHIMPVHGFMCRVPCCTALASWIFWTMTGPSGVPPHALHSSTTIHMRYRLLLCLRPFHALFHTMLPCSSSVHYLPIVRDRHVSTWSKWMLTFVLIRATLPNPPQPSSPHHSAVISSAPPHHHHHHHHPSSRNTASPPPALHNAHSPTLVLPSTTLPFLLPFSSADPSSASQPTPPNSPPPLPPSSHFTKPDRYLRSGMPKSSLRFPSVPQRYSCSAT